MIKEFEENRKKDKEKELAEKKRKLNGTEGSSDSNPVKKKHEVCIH